MRLYWKGQHSMLLIPKTNESLHFSKSQKLCVMLSLEHRLLTNLPHTNVEKLIINTALSLTL